MKISLIVATSENNVIGRENKMPWHLPTDLKRFKKLTSGHHILMGRKTFESIGKPLPNRVSVIISKNKHYKAEGCKVVDSLEKAIAFARIEGDSECFVIGGGQIYELALPLADKVYLTRVHERIQGDAYFPELDPTVWLEVASEYRQKSEKDEYDFSFLEYERATK